MDTVPMGPLADLLPAIWVMGSQCENQILFSVRKHFRTLGTQWPKYCSPNSGKTPKDIKVTFSLIQVCRIVLFSTNMSYVCGLIPRRAEQTRSTLPTKGVERTRQLEM